MIYVSVYENDRPEILEPVVLFAPDVYEEADLYNHRNDQLL